MSESSFVKGEFKRFNWLSGLLFFLCAGDLIGFFIYYLYNGGADSWRWSAGLYMLMIFGAIILFAGAFALMNLKPSLEVSSATIVGKTRFGKRVNLPTTQLSAVGTLGSDKITFATSSGSIAFSGLINRDEVYDFVSRLINEREKRGAAPEASDASELKKYKDLLDSGAITQEEYDRKKNQLLGL